jgi:hypothetical protein
MHWQVRIMIIFRGRLQMSRKRIVVALLLLVACSLGAAGYLQLTRTTGTQVADATSVLPETLSHVEPPVGTDFASDATDAPVAAPVRKPTKSPSAKTTRTASAEKDAGKAPSDDEEDSEITVESVHMPTTTIVLASTADSNTLYDPLGYGYPAGGSGGGGGGGGGPGGGEPGGGGGEPGSGGGPNIGDPDDEPKNEEKQLAPSAPDGNPSGPEAPGSAEPEGGTPTGDPNDPPRNETPSNPPTPGDKDGPGDPAGRSGQPGPVGQQARRVESLGRSRRCWPAGHATGQRRTGQR